MSESTQPKSTATAARPADGLSSHWYSKAGEPMHFVERSDGKGTRPATLRDAKKLGLLPSPTSILKVLRAPQLEAWLIEQACLAVLTAPRNPDEPLDAFVERVLHTEKQQDEQAAAARDLGTQIHAGVEVVLGGGECEKAVEPYVLPAVAEMRSRFGTMQSCEAVVVGDRCAGKLDATFWDGQKTTIVDVKTTSNPPTKGSWLEHRLQLSFYAKALWSAGQIQTANVYVSTKVPGVIEVFEHTDWQETYEKGFLPLLNYWCFANNYHP